MYKDLKQTIFELTESVLSGTELFLLDVEIKGGSPPIIWVYIDSADGGVDMDACATISNELGLLLEAHTVYNGAYRLNVSSPGLSRPLSDKRQYPKNVERKARIKYKVESEYNKVEGILSRVTDREIVIMDEQGNTVPITFDSIVEAKIIPTI